MSEYEIGKDIQEIKMRLDSIETSLKGTETGNPILQESSSEFEEPLELEEFEVIQSDVEISESDESKEGALLNNYRLILSGKCKNWKVFHFPTGNEHYANHSGSAHVLDQAGNKVKWNAIEVGYDFGCGTNFPNHRFRNHVKNTDTVSWGVRRVDGYKKWSGWVHFTTESGSWIRWKYTCKC